MRATNIVQIIEEELAPLTNHLSTEMEKGKTKEEVFAQDPIFAGQYLVMSKLALRVMCEIIP